MRRMSDEAASPASLAIDGTQLENVTLYGEDYPGNMALLVAELPEPLTRNSYHVISVTNTTEVEAQLSSAN